ncbi:glutamate--tRNA ligase family protein, partial [Klebsiella pneumoniae]|nr:glutamate--tRNA ligase family protein [Klebsiella pneumoniae]
IFTLECILDEYRKHFSSDYYYLDNDKALHHLIFEMTKWKPEDDGLFAYNLAVVVDDHFQGITEIVRGADLIEPTVRQISLYQHFGWQAPDYLHLPLALNGDGNKLSKQNHAPALPEGDPRPEIVRALRFLNQAIPEEWQALSIDDLLVQAVANWQPAKIEHSQMAPAEL